MEEVVDRLEAAEEPAIAYSYALEMIHRRLALEVEVETVEEEGKGSQVSMTL